MAKLQSQVFSISGTFNVPVGVTAVMISATAGGSAGGGYTAATGDAGVGSGAAAEYCLSRKIPVTSGGTLSIVVGAGGVGKTGNGNVNAGAVTTFGGFTVNPGRTNRTDSSEGGDGGGVGGGLSNRIVSAVLMGARESISYFGGCAGITVTPYSGQTKASDGCAPAYGSRGIGGNSSGGFVGGCGGSGTPWPKAGDGGVPSANGSNATGWGGGGGECGNQPGTATGGSGSGGAVVVYWVA